MLKRDVGAQVGFEVRTSWYFFRRDHKFMLSNHYNHSNVFVMLIRTPLTVIKSKESTSITYYYDNEDKLQHYINYTQHVDLSDYTFWKIKSSFRFKKNSSVYIGYNVVNPGFFLDPHLEWGSFFIINGTGKNADWYWTQPED